MRFVALWLAMIAASPATMAAAQQAAAPAGPSASSGQGGPAMPTVTICGQPRAPLAQPPAGSPPVVLFIAPCFTAQGGTSVIDPQTYVYYIHLKTSQPSQGIWIPYDES